jgi:quercetin dioxygenase-like cupin family protein
LTTLASPTQGQSAQAVWRVEMRPGQAGPLHGIDAEQIWTVLDGGASIEAGADTAGLGPGDTIVLPAGIARRITADAEAGLAAIVVAPASMRAFFVTGTPAGPHPAVPDGDKIVPAWVAQAICWLPAGRHRRSTEPELRELWAEDGANLTDSVEARGHEARAARIEQSHNKWIRTGPFGGTPPGPAKAVGRHAAGSAPGGLDGRDEPRVPARRPSPAGRPISDGQCPGNRWRPVL